MTEDSLDALASTAGRRTKVLIWGFYGLTIALGAWLSLEFGFLGIAAAGVWLLAWTLELFELDGRIELQTNKSRATVREEFSGPDMPLFALNRRMADSFTELEAGFEVVHSNVLSSTRVRFEAVEPDGTASDAIEPDASDDPITIQVYENDEHARTVTVTVDPIGGQTRVLASFGRPASALLVLLDRLYRPLERRALAAQGYVLVEDDTSSI